MRQNFALGRFQPCRLDHDLAGVTARHVQLQCSAKQTPSSASYASVNVFTYTLVLTTPTTPQHSASTANVYPNSGRPISGPFFFVITY